MALMVIEDYEWLFALEPVGQLGFELSQILQELWPFGLGSQFDELITILRTQSEADRTINCSTIPLLCSGMEVWTCSR